MNPDRSRVLLREFNISPDTRITRLIGRIMSLSQEQVKAELAEIMCEFGERHRREHGFFLRRYRQLKPYMLTDQTLDEERQLLIGAYFSCEYSLESAALFNPSMVWHPDQTGLPEGSKRFILSLRATGEGHISSITFRSGVISRDNAIVMDEISRFVTAPERYPNASYERNLFEQKLLELGLGDHEFIAHIMDSLEENFSMAQLKAALKREEQVNRIEYRLMEKAVMGMLNLAQSNYEIAYEPEQHLSERIIFPHAPTETNGIEDARFVEFTDEKGKVTYYATYSAYDGRTVLPQLLETEDFLRFKMSTLNGTEVQNKGMALFPRKIDGRYAMISRQDGEHIYLMFSDQVNFWFTKELLLKPSYPWEFVQLGNCGSPLETPEGWILLTHGVGPLRTYNIGAVLLDLKDPSKVLGRLREPLLSPDAVERDGYVPNVVYSCGAQIHNDTVILPYAMSDYASSIATVTVKDLLAGMI